MSAAQSAIAHQARPDFSGAILRLKTIVAESGDALLTEGPVNPDHRLLDLCADALHHLVHSQRAMDARSWDWMTKTREERDIEHAKNDVLYQTHCDCDRSAKPSLRLITKMKATTAAGIYAKAAVVRASKTGATQLAMSLATDLLDCPALRASLWPAGEG